MKNVVYGLVVLFVGSLFGAGAMGFGLKSLGYLDRGKTTEQDSLTIQLRQKVLRASTPDREVVYEPTTDTVNVCTSIPEFLVANAPDPAPTPNADGTAPTPGPTINAYWLPRVDGDPAITVTSSYTRAQLYDPNTLRGHVYTWQHPQHTFTLAPIATIALTPRGVTLRAGAELDVRVSPMLLRLSGGVQPMLDDPLAPWFGVTVRPFSWSFL